MKSSAVAAVTLEPCEILLIVQRHLLENDEENLEIISHEFRRFTEDAQGFLSNHRYLCIVAKHRVKERVIGHQLQFFAKLAPFHSAALSKYLEDINVFDKESNINHYLIPRLENVNIGKVFAPKCYLTRNDILVFEDLKESNYRLGTTTGALLDYEHLKIALKTLACMHSASIVLESRTQKSIPDLYPKCVIENSHLNDSTSSRYISYELCVETLCSFIPLIPQFADSPDIAGITEKFTEVMQKIFDFVKSSDNYRNVFCHGDLWGNNLLFRYENSTDQGSVPVHCKLIDFQFSRYTPPAMDVLGVLCIPTTRLFRQNNLSSLLDEYYKFLGEFLTNHNINIEEELPREQFDDSVEFYKLAALIESGFFCHVTLLPTDIANSICSNSDDFQLFLSEDRVNMCVQAFESDSVYRERITDTILEIVENYILPESKD